ncbi:MAG: substrate-binding domain-containing protein [Thiohalophilus sp.]|uniref:substrate-binding domain-containing protein n=1 Tax=Thiohalophilus sp. TaxID=3028392 RepID=UPI00287011A4|nr:substrate-binding domain-containing protein [Thiohalophilus sp.]MDR9436840.1 substrate-binding domain-containing protein [Thiohalophilus sp.]
MTLHKLFKLLSVGLLCLLTTGLFASEPNQILRLATTTSTENSGLLQAILPAFEKNTGYEVHVIAVGTGKALRMGRDGDVDLVLVHAPLAEENFVNHGYGVNRRQVMYNDFVMVGPQNDPASIRGMQDPIAALTKIAQHQALFVSRGDDSGTNKKELHLWDAAGIKPQGSWYRRAGQGMGKVLQMSGELDAYTLTDRGTWLAMRDKLPLAILTEGDPRLFNPYGIIAVNPERYPDANYAGAIAMIHWITAKRGQQLIGQYRVQGEPLFSPMALKMASQ